MDRDHDLLAILADGTRYKVYRRIVSQPGVDVTVADVAAEFGLHQNVARMHLAKLEQAGFLVTSFRRGRGGRPAKLYRLSKNVVSLNLPPRHFELLSALALNAIDAGGTREDAVRVSRAAGIDFGRQALAGLDRLPREHEEVAALVRETIEDQGLLPDVRWEGELLAVTVNNCSFLGISGVDHDLVCLMHRAFLDGLLRVITAGLGRLLVASDERRINRGDDACHLCCSFSPEQESE